VNIQEVMTMSIQSSVTVILANRPRLFRELLQHALNTQKSQFRVIESTDAMPSATLLRDADWLIVDEDAAIDAAKIIAAHPHLGVLSLEGRGSRARVLAPNALASEQRLSDIPTLSELIDVLSQEVAQRAR
jgi:hypothetical protein